MNEYNKMLDHVRKQLSKINGNLHGGKRKIKINYDRFEHIVRVYTWMQRILSELSSDIVVNEQALHIATIFHDAGYGVYEDKDQHALASAEICKKYMTKKKYDQILIDEVIFLISNHSNKSLLKKTDTPIELIILLEADLLDDTGAMAIIMDAMIQAKKGNTDFKKLYEHIVSHTVELMKENPMVTEPSIRIWEEKQALTMEFVRQLKIDLEMK